MRILVVTNLYPPHAHGGYELSCRDVMVRLADRGHDVAVLTTGERIAGVDDGPGEPPGAVERRLEWYWSDHRLLSPRLVRRMSIERRNQERLRRALDRHRPDVVSVWNMGAMSLGLLATVIERDIPLLLAVCDDWLCYGPRLDAWTRAVDRAGPWARAAARMLGAPAAPHDLGQRATVCFVSDFTRTRALEESRWSLPDTTVVYSGIDAEDFGPAPEDVGERGEWRGRLLYVGRLDERKGVFTILDALDHLPDSTLRLVGSGDPEVEQRLRDRIEAAGWTERVTMGMVERSALSAVYRDADAFVFASEWDEPFGLTPLEAMACGTPVVATGTGGSGEFLVEGHNCIRFQPGDSLDLAAAVGRLRRDPELVARLVTAGRATAAQLTTDGLTDALEEWHQAVAERFRHGRPDRRIHVGQDQ
ncbi:MAG TPA: glycosyltransferase family 4 protein [Acidimicrobiales bacterium]